MRLSERLSGRKQQSKSIGTGRIVTSADRRVSASCEDGRGQFAIASPWGVESIPGDESDAVIISGGSERLCIGVRQNYNPFGIKPGELVLHSGEDTYIYLREDGRIEIYGEVYVNGQRLEV